MVDSNPITMYIGLGAGFLMTSSMIPQLIKVWHTRSVKDLSVWTYFFYSLGILLWMIYGYRKNDWILSIFKFVALIVSCGILLGIWKFSYRTKNLKK